MLCYTYLLEKTCHAAMSVRSAGHLSWPLGPASEGPELDWRARGEAAKPGPADRRVLYGALEVGPTGLFPETFRLAGQKSLRKTSWDRKEMSGQACEQRDSTVSSLPRSVTCCR